MEEVCRLGLHVVVRFLGQLYIGLYRQCFSSACDPHGIQPSRAHG